ncbi:MAG: ferritin [Armatimonadetes bacterium]|nr:ferritin [Armatimonadota bacterium]
MLDPRMEQAINEQINREMWSGYIYLSMATWFDDLGLKGFSHWMRVQHKEEETHSLMMLGYVSEAGGRVLLAPIAAVDTEWSSPLAAFQEVLEHELKVSAWISELVDLALELKDHSTNAFLQWFVTEQVEEVSTAKGLVDTLKFVDGNPHSVLMLDRELGARAFTLPAPAAALGVL